MHRRNFGSVRDRQTALQRNHRRNENGSHNTSDRPRGFRNGSDRTRGKSFGPRFTRNDSKSDFQRKPRDFQPRPRSTTRDNQTRNPNLDLPLFDKPDTNDLAQPIDDPSSKMTDPPNKRGKSMDLKDYVKLRKARVIVRNLPFEMTDDQLKQEFSPFGQVQEVMIAKKPNGLMKGFGFVNFTKVMSAIKAIKEMNGKELKCGRFCRTIAVDFAQSKKKYEEHVYAIDKGDSASRKPSEQSTSDDSVVAVSANDQNMDSSDESADDAEDQTPDENDQSEEVDDVEMKEENLKIKVNDGGKMPYVRKESNDVEEGRTVFVRNLTFDTTADNLKEMMSSFGELEYCLLCVDKLTEHPKGTAFIKFKTQAGVEACLQAYSNLEQNEDQFYLDGRVVHVQPALSKTAIEKKAQEDQKLRDKRNLYLLREGLLYPDSPAAANVSPDDLNLRMQLAQQHKQQMELLHFFVAKNRLCIHNLPEDYTDQQLRQLVEGTLKDRSNARLLFCRVMRSKSRAGGHTDHSRGFGYVTLDNHLNALHVLRHLNNNPNVFSVHRRPIVEFSIENLNAIRKNKQKIVKESDEREEDLNAESVSFPWAGQQANRFGRNERVRTPLTGRKLKDKSKQIVQKRSEVRRTRREQMAQKSRKLSLKQNSINRRDHHLLRKRKSKPVDSDAFEQRFLSKQRPQQGNNETLSSGTSARRRPMKNKKWYD